MGNLAPYINFNGQCEEALHFYKSCLNGTIEEIMRFSDSPMELPEEQKKLIMHSRLHFWGGDIFLSDGMEGKPSSSSEHLQVNLLLPMDNLQLAETTFAKLAEGGSITEPLKKQFWGDIFGMLTDKFGVHWMVDYTEQKKNSAQ